VEKCIARERLPLAKGRRELHSGSPRKKIEIKVGQGRSCWEASYPRRTFTQSKAMRDVRGQSYKEDTSKNRGQVRKTVYARRLLKRGSVLLDKKARKTTSWAVVTNSVRGRGEKKKDGKGGGYRAGDVEKSPVGGNIGRSRTQLPGVRSQEGAINEPYDQLTNIKEIRQQKFSLRSLKKGRSRWVTTQAKDLIWKEPRSKTDSAGLSDEDTQAHPSTLRTIEIFGASGEQRT